MKLSCKLERLNGGEVSFTLFSSRFKSLMTHLARCALAKGIGALIWDILTLGWDPCFQRWCGLWVVAPNLRYYGGRKLYLHLDLVYVILAKYQFS